MTEYGTPRPPATPPTGEAPLPDERTSLLRWTPPTPLSRPPLAVTVRPENRNGRILPYVLVGVAAAAVVALIGALVLVLPGRFAPPVFNTSTLEQGVLGVLRDNYVIKAEVVACPPRVPVRKNLQFSCNALIEGRQQPVTVRVLDDQGRFEVVRPT